MNIFTDLEGCLSFVGKCPLQNFVLSQEGTLQKKGILSQFTYYLPASVHTPEYVNVVAVFQKTVEKYVAVGNGLKYEIGTLQDLEKEKERVLFALKFVAHHEDSLSKELLEKIGRCARPWLGGQDLRAWIKEPVLDRKGPVREVHRYQEDFIPSLTDEVLALKPLDHLEIAPIAKNYFDIITASSLLPLEEESRLKQLKSLEKALLATRKELERSRHQLLENALQELQNLCGKQNRAFQEFCAKLKQRTFTGIEEGQKEIFYNQIELLVRNIAYHLKTQPLSEERKREVAELLSNAGQVCAGAVAIDLEKCCRLLENKEMSLRGLILKLKQDFIESLLCFWLKEHLPHLHIPNALNAIYKLYHTSLGMIPPTLAYADANSNLAEQDLPLDEICLFCKQHWQSFPDFLKEHYPPGYNNLIFEALGKFLEESGLSVEEGLRERYQDAKATPTVEAFRRVIRLTLQVVDLG